MYSPAFASPLNSPVHVTKQLPCCSPAVTGQHCTLLTKLVYESAGSDVMTEYVMKWLMEECSSCLMSWTVPSAKWKRMMSVSGETPLTCSRGQVSMDERESTGAMVMW